MTTDLQDLEVWIGCKFDAVVTYQDPDGDPIDITGYTASLGVKREFSDETEVLTLTSGDGLTLGGTAGTIDIVITALQTADLTGTYRYSLTLTPSGGDPEHLVSGRIVCNPIA